MNYFFSIPLEGRDIPLNLAKEGIGLQCINMDNVTRFYLPLSADCIIFEVAGSKRTEWHYENKEQALMNYQRLLNYAARNPECEIKVEHDPNHTRVTLSDALDAIHKQNGGGVDVATASDALINVKDAGKIGKI